MMAAPVPYQQVVSNLETGIKQFNDSATQLDQVRTDLKKEVDTNLQDYKGDAPQAFFDTNTLIDSFTTAAIQSCQDTATAMQKYLDALNTAIGQQGPDVAGQGY